MLKSLFSPKKKKYRDNTVKKNIPYRLRPIGSRNMQITSRDRENIYRLRAKG